MDTNVYARDIAITQFATVRQEYAMLAKMVILVPIA